MECSNSRSPSESGIRLGSHFQAQNYYGCTLAILIYFSGLLSRIIKRALWKLFDCIVSFWIQNPAVLWSLCVFSRSIPLKIGVICSWTKTEPQFYSNLCSHAYWGIEATSDQSEIWVTARLWFPIPMLRQKINRLLDHNTETKRKSADHQYQW